jgi:hypothetical protein
VETMSKIGTITIKKQPSGDSALIAARAESGD